MLNYCKAKWAENEKRLEKVIRESNNHDEWCYRDLVKMVIDEVMNHGLNRLDNRSLVWDSKHITEIDDGDYQGSKIFAIPLDTYQPEVDEYLFTYVHYGSCSCCDTLLDIRYSGDNDDGTPTEQQVKDYMTLCRDIVVRMKQPFKDEYLSFEEAEV